VKHIFGPLISRRLGCSLGIDPVGYKTCSFDCIYCECGTTSRLSATRERFFPPEELLEEVDRFLSSNPAPDWITFGGSGEPLLSLDFPLFTRTIHADYPEIPQALLTNSVFLNDPAIRPELNNLSLILPSLDTALESNFNRINRPHPDIHFSTILEALISLRDNFQGNIWLEVFIIPGINDSKEEIEEFRRIITRIRPDRIQLNTLDRPGAVTGLRKADSKQLCRFRDLLHLPHTEIIARSHLPDTRKEAI